MSQDATTPQTQDAGESAAKAKLVELLKSAGVVAEAGNITLSPTQNDGNPQTTVYINAAMENKALEEIAHALVGTSGKTDVPVAFSPNGGSGAAIHFPGGMNDIAAIDPNAFTEQLAKYHDQQALEHAPVTALLNGEIAPAIKQILQDRAPKGVDQTWIDSTAREISKKVREVGKGAAQSGGPAIG